jgi:hypothetical protein
MNNVRAGTLSINGGTLSVAPNGTSAGASRIRALHFAGGATPTAALDLNDNDLIVEIGTYESVRDMVAFARNGGAWDRAGLTSSAARSANPRAKTLGVITGSQFQSVSGSTFNGFTVASTDVLVKFTYYGDTDFNGIINFDDYARIDAGFNNGGINWFGGDFDLTGLVNFDDYALIDLAFNTQTGTLIRAMDWLEGEDRSLRGMDTPALRLVMSHFDQFGVPYAQSFLNSVPEPGLASLIPITLLAMNRRRRN